MLRQSCIHCNTGAALHTQHDQILPSSRTYNEVVHKESKWTKLVQRDGDLPFLIYISILFSDLKDHFSWQAQSTELKDPWSWSWCSMYSCHQSKEEDNTFLFNLEYLSEFRDTSLGFKPPLFMPLVRLRICVCLGWTFKAVEWPAFLSYLPVFFSHPKLHPKFAHQFFLWHPWTVFQKCIYIQIYE